MHNIIGGLRAVNILAPLDAANTAAATSGWIDTRGYPGLIGVLLHVGVLDAGSITFSFEDATDGTGTGNAAIVPASGAPTVVTTANDNPFLEIAIFDPNAIRGWLRVIGTIVTGGALVSYALLALPKNAS